MHILVVCCLEWPPMRWGNEIGHIKNVDYLSGSFNDPPFCLVENWQPVWTYSWKSGGMSENNISIGHHGIVQSSFSDMSPLLLGYLENGWIFFQPNQWNLKITPLQAMNHIHFCICIYFWVIHLEEKGVIILEMGGINFMSHIDSCLAL